MHGGWTNASFVMYRKVLARNCNKNDGKVVAQAAGHCTNMHGCANPKLPPKKIICTGTLIFSFGVGRRRRNISSVGRIDATRLPTRPLRGNKKAMLRDRTE